MSVPTAVVGWVSARACVKVYECVWQTHYLGSVPSRSTGNSNNDWHCCCRGFEECASTLFDRREKHPNLNQTTRRRFVDGFCARPAKPRTSRVRFPSPLRCDKMELPCQQQTGRVYFLASGLILRQRPDGFESCRSFASIVKWKSRWSSEPSLRVRILLGARR